MRARNHGKRDSPESKFSHLVGDASKRVQCYGNRAPNTIQKEVTTAAL